MGFSFMHLLVVLVVVMLLFGSRFPKVMGDIGKGIKNLRDELDKEKPGTQTVLPPEQPTARTEDKDLKS